MIFRNSSKRSKNIASQGMPSASSTFEVPEPSLKKASSKRSKTKKHFWSKKSKKSAARELESSNDVSVACAGPVDSSAVKKSLWRRLFSRKSKKVQLQTKEEAASPFSDSENDSSVLESIVAPRKCKSSRSSSFKPYGTPQGATYEAFERANRNIFPSFQARSFKVKPAKKPKTHSVSVGTQCHDFSVAEALVSENASVGASKRKASHSSTTNSPSGSKATSSRSYKAAKVTQGELAALVAQAPSPKYAAEISEIRKNLPNPEAYTLLQALEYAQKAECSPRLAKVIKDVADGKFDARNCHPQAPVCGPSAPPSPGKYFASYFEPPATARTTKTFRMAASFSADPDAFLQCSPDFAAVAGSTLRSSTPSVSSYGSSLDDTKSHQSLQKELRDPAARRLRSAVSRFSGRFSTRAKTLRSHWREDRAARQVEKETKREIKLEMRTLTLLETEKQLAELKAQVSDVIHKKNQEQKDYTIAEEQRRHEARLANQRRKLDYLQHSLKVAQADKDVKSIYHTLWTKHEKENAETLRQLQAESKMFETNDATPQTSVFSASKPSLCPEATQSTQVTTPDACPQKQPRPSSSKYVSAPKFLDDREMERNPWDIGGEAGLRRYLAKEKPVFGVLSVPKGAEVDADFRPSSSESICHYKFSVENYLPPPPPKPEADFVFHSCPVPRPNVPPPPKPTGTPFWETKWYNDRRKELTKPRYAAAEVELVEARSKLRKIPFDWNY